MTPIAITACAAVLWSCAAAAVAADASKDALVAPADGPSLAEMTQIIESQGLLSSAAPLFDFFGMFADEGPVESRGKKPKPMKMAMTMVGAAATSMMMMKAMGAIKLFIIHSFFATKLALVIGAYLLACKMMEMKQTPPKKVVKWVSAPPSFDEHGSAAMMMPAPYPDSIQSSYEPHQDQQQQQAPSDQYGPPPSDQYGPPPSSQHQSQFGDFGGGGDMQAHYSHVSPVTYRPMIKSDKLTKSGVGRIQ